MIIYYIFDIQLEEYNVVLLLSQGKGQQNLRTLLQSVTILGARNFIIARIAIVLPALNKPFYMGNPGHIELRKSIYCIGLLLIGYNVY